MKTTRVIYEGRVQGVGFRWTTLSIAKGFDVAGSVRNLPDGTVELVASGEPEEVRAFLAAVRESSLAGHIAAERAETIQLPAPPRGFRVAE